MAKTPFPAYHTYSVIKVTELFPYRIRMPVGYQRVLSMCEPWQDPPQDHPKGLVHGTGIAICSDKDSFYLPFFTRTQLYVLTNSVGLTQKIKDQAL